MAHVGYIKGHVDHNSGWQFWIDRGGTFTDIVAKKRDGTLKVHKFLSEQPEHYKDAAIAGICEILKNESIKNENEGNKK